MTRRLSIAAACALSLTAAALAAGTPGAAGVAGTVYTVDGQKLVGTITDPTVAMKTDYGTVTVPMAEVTAAYPGVLVSDMSRKRIDQLVQKLSTANRNAAATELKAMGRVCVPQLQSATEGTDKKLAKEASAVLKEIWPTGAKVPSNGIGVLMTKGMELRGSLQIERIHVEGAFGKQSFLPLAIQLVQIGAGKVQPAGDPPVYPPLKSAKTPELELTMADASLLVGTLDVMLLDVETAYGTLKVPVKDIISVEFGDPDKIVTREMTLQGKLSTATLEIQSKVGAFRVDRDTVKSAKAVLDETGTASAQPANGALKTDVWIDIFNGKDLSNWSTWGSGTRKVEDKTIHLIGDAGAKYLSPDDIKNCIVAASVKINKTTGPGGGVKITVRDGEDGTYYVFFDGRNGTIAKWDNRLKKAFNLKQFQAEPAPDDWHMVQFGISESMMLAYINGKSVCEIKVDPKDILPAGQVTIGVWNCDASFREVQLKLFK